MFRLVVIFLLLCHVALGNVTTRVAELSTGNVTRTGTLTLVGNTPASALSVTVNGLAAQTNGDFTFAATNLALVDGANAFTNIAVNAYGVRVTNIVRVNLPTSPVLRYDSNGNLTNDGTRSFTYDAQDQLTAITVTNAATGGSAKTEFVYDGLGRRRIQRDYAWSGGSFSKTNEVRFIYDGYLLVQERDTNSNVLVTYTRGLDLSGSLSGAGGIGGLLGRTDANGSTYYHADGSGNVTALIDSQQTMAARYMYSAFGGQVGKWGALADRNAMQFSSMPRLAASGLSLYPFRAYDPSLQRWTQPDPIGEEGGINLYGFVGNNPTSRIDPLGLAYGDWYDPRTWFGSLPGGVTELPNGDLYMPPPASAANSMTFGGMHGIDTDWMGGRPGDFIADQAGEVGKDTALAMSMLTPLGEEEEGAELTGALGNKIKQAFNKCRNKAGKLGQFKGADALRAENKLVRAAAKEAQLNRDQAQTLHRLATEAAKSGTPLSYTDMLNLARDVAGGLH